MSLHCRPHHLYFWSLLRLYSAGARKHCVESVSRVCRECSPPLSFFHVSLISVPIYLVLSVSALSTFSVFNCLPTTTFFLSAFVLISFVSALRTRSLLQPPLRVTVFFFFYAGGIIDNDSFLFSDPSFLGFKTGAFST